MKPVIRTLEINRKPVFKRPCRDCETLFLPRGKYSKLCDNCLTERYKNVGSKRHFKPRVSSMTEEIRDLRKKEGACVRCGEEVKNPLFLNCIHCRVIARGYQKRKGRFKKYAN